VFEVGKRRGQLRSIVIPVLLLSGGVLSYFVGLFRGFLFLFGGALFQIVDFNIVFSMPFLVMASYPHFSIVYLPSFFAPYYGLSPLSLCFLLCGVASIFFALFGRYVAASVFALAALIFGLTQVLLLFSISGFDLTRSGLIVLPTSPTGITPSVVLFFEKRIIVLIFSIILLGAGITYCQRIQHAEAKRLLGGFEAPSLEHFKILKTTQIKRTPIILPLLIFPLVGIYDWLLLRLEFPNYYYFLGLLNWWNNVFFVSLLITFYIFSLSIVEIYRYSDLNKFLAKSYTSIIIKTLEKNTILPLEVLQRSLKVEEANKKHFENLIDRVCSEAEKLGDPTGIYKGYVFLERSLVQVAQREIGKEGEADVYKIASELLVTPEILTEIYRYLTFAGKIKGFMVTSEGFLTKYEYHPFGLFRSQD